MQESLKMFDFPGGLLSFTHNLTFGRGKTFYKKPQTLETLANLSRAKKMSLHFFKNLQILRKFKISKFLKFQNIFKLKVY